MVVAKAEFAQSYMHQLKMILLRSFSIGPFIYPNPDDLRLSAS